MRRTTTLLTTLLTLALALALALALVGGCGDPREEDYDDVLIGLEGDPAFSAALGGQVIEANGNAYDDTNGLVMALLWSVYDPATPYYPTKAGSIAGDSFPAPFTVAVDGPPPDEARFQVESVDADVGVVTDPDAPWVARASLYIVTAEALDDEEHGVERIGAFDTDAVVGMVPEVSLFYAPEPLASGAGVRGLYPADGVTVPEGYSLWRWGPNGDDVRIDLDTSLEALLGYVAD